MYAVDQRIACAGNPSSGSTTTGYAIKPTSDPRFDNAYRRQGGKPGRDCVYQA